MKIDCAIKSRRIQAVKLANALNTIQQREKPLKFDES